MDFDYQKNSLVQQINSGDGDNVAGNKIIVQYQELLPEKLREPIDLVLSDIRERRQNDAKLRLETIKATSGLDSNSKAVIDMLSYQLNLLEENEAQDVYSSLLSTYNKLQDPIVIDLCLANLIRLEAKRNQTYAARQRYLDDVRRSSYSDEAYYECIATKEELIQIYENKNNLDYGLLNGIFLGAFRTGSFEFALTVAHSLKNITDSLNSNIFLLLATAANINSRINKKPFWIITATLKKEIFSLIDNLILLIEKSKGRDPRLFNIAAPCLEYTIYEYKELMDVCWKYIDEIEKNHPEIAAILYLYYKNDVSKIKDKAGYSYQKAKIDRAYRTKLLNEFFIKKELSGVEFAIFSDFSDSKKVNDWVNSGGIIVGKDDLETDLYQIELLLASSEQTPLERSSKIERVNSQCQKVIKNHEGKMSHLNPIILIKLTDKLSRNKETYDYVGALIKPLLPLSDLWPSPIVESYLNYLLHRQQAKTLETILSKINKSEWTNFVWRI